MFKLLNQYRRIVSSRAYFPLWLAQLVSSFGDTLNYVALVVLIYRLTNSGLAVSTGVVFEILPILILGPVAGVVIDRFARKAVLITSDLVRAGLALGLAVATEPWQVYMLAAGMAAAGVFFNPTVQAVIPTMVKADLLLAANSVAWSTGRLVQILGSAIAAGLVSSLGTTSAFATNALSFVFSAWMISRLPIPPHSGEVSQAARRGLNGWIKDTRAGFSYTVHNHFISRLLIVQALSSLSVGATSALLVVLAERHLKLPPSGFAWLLLAIGVGALLGPLLFGSFIQDYRQVRYLFVPYVIRGLGDILLGMVTSLPLVVVLLFIYGLNTSSGMVVYNSLLQSEVKDEVRGRVYTLLDVMWNLMRLVSLGIGGLVADYFGVETVYYAGGTLLVGSGLLGLALLRDYTFSSGNQ
jgi:MFS family permease